MKKLWLYINMEGSYKLNTEKSNKSSYSVNSTYIKSKTGKAHLFCLEIQDVLENNIQQ